MLDFFWLQVALSFVVGGAYIAASIWTAERFGSKWGGIITGLPSTGFISFMFIAWTQGTPTLLAALPIVPAAFSACSLFLAAFVALRGFGVTKALAAGVVAWLAFTLPLALTGFNDLPASIALAAAVFAAVLYYFRKLSHSRLAKQDFSGKDFVYRAVFSGFIVAAAVTLAKVSGPLWGGLFASFPAAFSSAMFLLSKRHGVEFAASAAKTMPIGSIGNVLSAVAVYYLVPAVGLVQGFILGYAASVAITLCAFKLIHLKRSTNS